MDLKLKLKIANIIFILFVAITVLSAVMINWNEL